MPYDGMASFVIGLEKALQLVVLSRSHAIPLLDFEYVGMHYPRRRIRKWEEPISKNKGREAQHLGDFSLVKTIVAIIEEKCNIGIFKIPIDKFVKGVLSVLQAPFCLLDDCPCCQFLSQRGKRQMF